VRRAVVAVFCVLVAATFAAFFVAQRLKNTPSIVQKVRIITYGPGGAVFSPNGDGRRDFARIAFRLKKADDVTVQMLDAEGDPVRTLLDDKHLDRYQQIFPALRWNGRDDAGRLVSDGRYRIKITLRHQGRALIVQRSILKDTEPPVPKLIAIGPQRGRQPEFLPEPGGGAARIHFRAVPEGPAAKGMLYVFRTGPGMPRKVRSLSLPGGTRTSEWNGTNDAGRRVSPGTYLVVLEWRDVAGNIGTSVPLGRDGLPVLQGGKLPGHGGITVRYLGARPPVTPVEARERTTIDVDARQERYTWSLRRLGQAPRKRSTGAKTKPTVIFGAPGGKSGVYIFEARTRTHRTEVVLPVQARRPVAGTAAKPHGVLVLLPLITWQGHNAVDDDGDGAPNTLDLGATVQSYRIWGGDGLPQGFTEHEGPLLQWLDRQGKRYDINTDLGLQAGRGPQLAGHAGVLIPGDARWLPTRVRTQLKAFARGGGTVVSLGIDSLRRTVRVDATGTLSAPSRALPTDLFGARLRPLQTKTTNLENFEDDPAVSLFQGGTGVFTDVPQWEATDRVGDEANILSRAVTADPAHPENVIVAAQFGQGLVIRPGFPSFATRLSTDDPAVTALMARMWTLLSR